LLGTRVWDRLWMLGAFGRPLARWRDWLGISQPRARSHVGSLAKVLRDQSLYTRKR